MTDYRLVQGSLNTNGVGILLEEGEIPLRLLRHYTSSVHHQKFHGLDVVTVQVKAAG